MGEVETVALEYKVLVIGSTQVGKSSFINRYTTGKFPRGMLATVGKLRCGIVGKFLCASERGVSNCANIFGRFLPS